MSVVETIRGIVDYGGNSRMNGWMDGMFAPVEGENCLVVEKKKLT